MITELDPTEGPVSGQDASISDLPIAVVINAFWPVEGGAERQLRQVLQELGTRRGADITVVTRPVSGTDDEEALSGMRVLRVPHVLNRTPAPTQRLLFSGTAVAMLTRLRPSIVISSQLDAATIASGVYSAARRIPQIVRLAGGASDESGRTAGDIERLSGARGRLITTVLARPNVRVVAPASHLVVAGLRSGVLHPDRTLLIRNGVEAAAGAGTEALTPPREGVIWYGKDSPVKNVPAFVALVDAAPEHRFVAVGAVELPARANLTRLGWVPDPREVIAACTVVVSTSRFEGSPNFLLQAISLGLRVVAFENDALRELRDDYPDHVALAPMDDVTALRRSIDAALRAPAPPPVSVPSIRSTATEWARLIATAVGERISSDG